MSQDLVTVQIPQAVENLKLPDDSLLNFYEGIENRTFWINDEINIYLLNLVHYIIKWNREDEGIPPEERKPIKLLFFSPGGDLDINYTIIDMIHLSKTPVIGVNLGQCASAAAFIFLSCHKRYMLKHAHFIFHQGSGTLTGTFGEICSQVEDYQEQVDELAHFMIKHTNYTEEEIDKNIVGEWYVRAAEAIEKGVCDKMIESIEEVF